jgi:hypothetical protein
VLGHRLQQQDGGGGRSHEALGRSSPGHAKPVAAVRAHGHDSSAGQGYTFPFQLTLGNATAAMPGSRDNFAWYRPFDVGRMRLATDGKPNVL